MEFIVRALRGWAVPLVILIPQAWRVFQQGQLLNEVGRALTGPAGDMRRERGRRRIRQLRGRHVARAHAALPRNLENRLQIPIGSCGGRDSPVARLDTGGGGASERALASVACGPVTTLCRLATVVL